MGSMYSGLIGNTKQITCNGVCNDNKKGEAIQIFIAQDKR